MQEPPNPARHVHNVGAPMSRARSETIRSSYRLENNPEQNDPQKTSIWFIQPLTKTHDTIEMLEKFARKAGYQNLEEAMWKIPIPPNQALAIERMDNVLRQPRDSGPETLRHAAVLCRIGNHYYDPARPPVISLRRLNRIMELTDFPNQSFYELD